MFWCYRICSTCMFLGQSGPGPHKHLKNTHFTSTLKLYTHLTGRNQPNFNQLAPNSEFTPEDSWITEDFNP